MSNPITNLNTVDEAKKYLRQNYEKGTECPCCNQFVKLYKRKITSSMARCLINLVQKFDKTKDYVWYEDIFSVLRIYGGDFSKLQYWGLIENKPKDEDGKDTRSSGFWKPTLQGIQFVIGTLKVPKYALVYNNKVQGFSPNKESVEDALGSKYSYNEVMGDFLTSETIIYDKNVTDLTLF